MESSRPNTKWPSPRLANLPLLYHPQGGGSTYSSPPRHPSSTSTTITAYIIMSGSSGCDHQPAMHDPKDKIDLDSTGEWAIRGRKPPDDKMTAKDAGSASKEKGKVKRTKSTDKKSVSCSIESTSSFSHTNTRSTTVRYLRTNAVNGLTVYNEVTEKLRPIPPLRHTIKPVGYVTCCLQPSW